jgi:antitoxin component YwqK of YwqJK toxin-antitoxin module
MSKRKCIKVGIVFLLNLLLSVGSQAQEMNIPDNKAIKVVAGDTVELSAVLLNTAELKPQLSKRYYWYDKGSIQSNVGGYHAKPLHGKYELFVKGKLYTSGHFVKGLKQGAWRYWGEGGKLLIAEEWHEGRLSGKKSTYNDKGFLESEYHYKEGVKDGPYKHWKEGVGLVEEGKLKDGKKHGTIYYYSDKGEQLKEKYKQGVLQEKKARTKRKEKDSDHPGFFEKIKQRLSRKKEGEKKEKKTEKDKKKKKLKEEEQQEEKKSWN